MKHIQTLFCTVKKFETVIGTLIQYLHDGDILTVRIQCSVLEVLERIINNYLLLNLNQH